MKRSIAALLIFFGLASAALAQRVQAPGSVAIVCAYNASPPSLTTGWFGYAQCDNLGQLLVSGGGGGGGAVTVADGADVTQGAIADATVAAGATGTVSAKLRRLTTDISAILTALGNVPVSGTIASGAADSGNPVKTGCVFNSTLPTITNGQRADCQSDASANQRILLTGLSNAGSDGVSNGSVVVIGNNTSQAAAARPFQTGKWNFNGSTWDRDFTCPSSAVVNVTAGNTTEIVALTASQVIRVCSIAVSMSLAGTVTFTSGTGTNCGTGTTALSGAMTLGTGTPLTLSGQNGSVLRPAVANAFCIAAATGNVTGFITYAKY